MRSIAVIAFLAAAALLAYRLGDADVRGGEEGRHAVMARNLAEAPGQFLNPSPEPAGPPGDTPFPYPLLLMLSIRLFGPGEWALRLPSVLATLLAGVVLYQLGRRQHPLAGLAALGLFLFDPATSAAARQATPAAWATLLGALGFATATGGHCTRAPRPALAGGVLGASFLVRPWLCVPAVLGALAALEVPAAVRTRGRGGRPRLAFAVAFLLTASAHLILISLFSPSQGQHWLGALLTSWPWHPGEMALPPHVHESALAALVPVVPLLTLGLPTLLTRSSEPAYRGILIWWLASFLLPPVWLNDPATSGLRVAATAAAAAAGAGTLARWCHEELWRFPAEALALWAVLAVGAGLALLPALSPASVELGGAALLLAGMCAWSALAWVAAGRSATPFLKLGLCALAVCGLVAARGERAWRVARALDARNSYRTLSPLVNSQIQGAALDAVAFVAPEPEALSYYTYRRGLGWISPDGRAALAWNRFASLADGRHARVFVLPRPEPAAFESEPSLARAARWLASNKLEITDSLGRALGAPPPCRVFLNGAPALPALGPERPPGVPARKAIILPRPAERHYRRL